MPRLPSIQLTGSQTMTNGYPNPGVPLTEVWKDDAFEHSNLVNPERIYLQPGRYQLYVEVYCAGANQPTDIMALYAINGTVVSVITRPCPVTGVAVDYGFTGEYEILITAPCYLSLISYKSSANSLSVDHRLTLVRLDTPNGLLVPEPSRSMQASGSLSIPNINYPPAASHPFNNVAWCDSDFEIAQDGTYVRFRRPGRFAFHVAHTTATMNCTDWLLEHSFGKGITLATGTWVRYIRHFMFNVASGVPITGSNTVVRQMAEGDAYMLRTYHNAGSTKTITHTLTVEEL